MMRFSKLFPLFLLAVFFCAGGIPGRNLPRGGEKPAVAVPSDLLSPDPALRRRAARRFKDRLDAEGAEELVHRLSVLDDAQRRAVMDLLASGGPWMPGVLRALSGGKDEETNRFAARILLDALDRRPLDDEPSPLLDAPHLFGEGAAFAFPGTWPRSVPLDEFLDRLDESANSPYPFVLDPDLAGEAGDALAVAGPPPGGPAPMVIDVLLGKRGLGLELLESVAMVTRGGGRILELNFQKQGFDSRLMEKIIRALSSGADEPAVRRSALRALSALDPPGFFEGYLRELRAGKGDDCLAYLLSSTTAFRLSARIALEDDLEQVLSLVRFYEKDPEGSFGRPLERFLLRLPPGLARRALEEGGPFSRPAALFLAAAARQDRELSALISLSLSGHDPIEMRAALMAAGQRVSLSPEVRKVFENWLKTSPRLDSTLAAPADACLAAAAPRLGDSFLARLIFDGPRVSLGGSEPSGGSRILPGLVEGAARAGGVKCFDALLGLFAAQGEGGAAALDALRRIARRGQIGTLSVKVGENDNPLAASLFKMILTGREKDRKEAAALLAEAARRGGRDALRALPFFSFLSPRRILAVSSPFLKAAASGRRSLPPVLRRAFISSALAAAGDDPTAAAAMRIALKKALGQGMDPLLDIALKDVSRLGKPGSFTVFLRFE